MTYNNSYNPTIYEINARIWIKRFGSNAKLTDVPETYWDELKQLGFDYVWLMGVWKTNPETVDKYCFEPGLINDYNKALKDWRDEDVIGSPYAIDVYEVNPLLGTREDLLALKETLNKKGIKLILDYVSNHFSAASSLIETEPELFLRVNEEHFEEDEHTYYKPNEEGDKYFGHGRDPFYPAWQDTIQINHFHPKARTYMIDLLKELTEVCDGVRCDMAMLSLNNVFKNTWGGVLKEMNYIKPETEFWLDAINTIKAFKPEFLFLGEAYWDMEWQLQKLGFDYTYDKELLDRLVSGQVSIVKDHLKAEQDYQGKSIRFIENHDEKRAMESFGKDMSKAAAVIISTVKGMRFYHDGQFEGKKAKIPMQLGREPNEKVNEHMKEFYTTLLNITNEKVFKQGEWEMAAPESSWNDNESHKNLVAFHWQLNSKRRLVVVNYSHEVATARIRLNMKGYPESVRIHDLLNHELYMRSSEEMQYQGLYVKLNPYESHIFAF